MTKFIWPARPVFRLDRSELVWQFWHSKPHRLVYFRFGTKCTLPSSKRSWQTALHSLQTALLLLASWDKAQVHCNMSEKCLERPTC